MSKFSLIPAEIVEIIFNLLDPISLSHCESVCTSWSSHAKNDTYWEKFLSISPINKTKKEIFVKYPLYQKITFWGYTKKGESAGNTLTALKKSVAQASHAELEKMSNLREPITSRFSEIKKSAIIYDSFNECIKADKNNIHFFLADADPMFLKHYLTDVALYDLIKDEPSTIIFILLTKNKSIRNLINTLHLSKISEKSPQFIPLILNNPYPDILDRIDEYVLDSMIDANPKTIEYLKEHSNSRIKEIAHKRYLKNTTTEDKKEFVSSSTSMLFHWPSMETIQSKNEQAVEMQKNNSTKEDKPAPSCQML